MNELIQMMTDGRVFVVPIIGAIVFGVKCLVSSEIDLVFYSRFKQLVTRLVKWLFGFLYFFVIYFAIAEVALNSDMKSQPWIKCVNTICCIVIVAAFVLLLVLFLLVMISPKVKKFMMRGKGFILGNVLCLGVCVASAVAFGIADLLIFCEASKDTSLIVICIIIIGIALLQNACMYLYVEWVGYICPIHIYVELDIKDDDKGKTEYNVNGENKKKQVLYPLYEVENGMLMCKIKSDKKEDLYIRISKNKLKNVAIHVQHGDDSIEADSEDNETQKKKLDKKDKAIVCEVRETKIGIRSRFKSLLQFWCKR